MKRKRKQIWVDPDYAKILKMEALDNDMQTIPYTKQLARKKRRLKDDFEIKF